MRGDRFADRIGAKNVVAMPKGVVARLACERAGATYAVAIRNDRSPSIRDFQSGATNVR
jgi:hypothetical protein